jgi:hypothetical protein
MGSYAGYDIGYENASKTVFTESAANEPNVDLVNTIHGDIPARNIIYATTLNGERFLEYKGSLRSVDSSIHSRSVIENSIYDERVPILETTDNAWITGKDTGLFDATGITYLNDTVYFSVVNWVPLNSLVEKNGLKNTAGTIMQMDTIYSYNFETQEINNIKLSTGSPFPWIKSVNPVGTHLAIHQLSCRECEPDFPSTTLLNIQKNTEVSIGQVHNFEWIDKTTYRYKEYTERECDEFERYNVILCYVDPETLEYIEGSIE